MKNQNLFPNEFIDYIDVKIFEKPYPNILPKGEKLLEMSNEDITNEISTYCGIKPEFLDQYLSNNGLITSDQSIGQIILEDAKTLHSLKVDREELSAKYLNTKRIDLEEELKESLSNYFNDQEIQLKETFNKPDYIQVVRMFENRNNLIQSYKKLNESQYIENILQWLSPFADEKDEIERSVQFYLKEKEKLKTAASLHPEQIESHRWIHRWKSPTDKYRCFANRLIKSRCSIQVSNEFVEYHGACRVSCPQNPLSEPLIDSITRVRPSDI